MRLKNQTEYHKRIDKERTEEMVKLKVNVNQITLNLNESNSTVSTLQKEVLSYRNMASKAEGATTRV